MPDPTISHAAKEWLAARTAIATALREWWGKLGFDIDDAERYASAILARLASHDPPILLDLGGAACEEAERLRGLVAQLVEACEAIDGGISLRDEEELSLREAMGKVRAAIREARGE